MIETNIAIVGAGPGGYVAALRAAQLGASVVLVERTAVGGVCLNEGCIPTKALLRSAEVVELARRASEFGVRVGEVALDWPAVQARKNEVRNKLVRSVSTLLKGAGVNVLAGEARLARSHTLVISSSQGQETIVADSIILATGSRHLDVPIPGLDDPGILTSGSILELETLPESLGIIGSGAIGTEFASLMNAAGVKVTLVEMLPRIAPLMDDTISDLLARSLRRSGIEIRTGTRVTSVERTDSGFRLHMHSDKEGDSSLEVGALLSAIGRAPNTENLGLEAVGIQPTRKGILVDDCMQTSVPGIYAVGDCAAEGAMLAHVASAQGIVAVEHALGLPARMDYRVVPSCIFSLPEVAAAGLTEAQAREAGHEVITGMYPMAANGKALAYGDTEGVVKLVADASTHAVLGMHVMGPHASDLILEGTLLCSMEYTLEELVHTIHSHPTLGETIPEAALAALERPLHIAARRRRQ
ncbi:MAG: dihydrolipoyl dehydrogenase [Anaerolineae bacterium]|jgi:dihydrolipoamide dehydrogenase|nr:dihydrolipoyl dehydrogenase [Chloroflexota bacterium]